MLLTIPNIVIYCIASLFIIRFAQSATFYEVVTEDWKTWKLMHQKEYDNQWEEKFRFKVYMENKARIARHNAQAHKGEKTYFLKMNKYGDLLNEEFKEHYNGYNYHKKYYLNDAVTHIHPAHVLLPDSVDWRKHGAVTSVKNQSSCGSCYAFAATGALEGQHFRKTGKLVSLSEQNIVDCTKKFGNDGCDGGLMDNAYRYIQLNGGLDTESSYPYTGKVGTCKFDPKSIGATDKGYVDLPVGDEESLKGAVATIGPVTVAIDASQYGFQFYSHGIYHDKECDGNNVNHAVLVVGYGENEEGEYWIVKNSWSHHWGNNGYIKMARNAENMCGIANIASYPLV